MGTTTTTTTTSTTWATTTSTTTTLSSETSTKAKTVSSLTKSNFTEATGKGCSCVPNFIFDFYGRTMVDDNYYFYYFDGAPSEQDIEDMEDESDVEDEDNTECYCVEVQEKIEEFIE